MYVISVSGYPVWCKNKALKMLHSKLAFSGLAVLFPVTLAVLHWKKVHNGFAIVSIIIGELLLIGFYYKWLPSEWLMGFESFIFVLVVCFALNLLGQFFYSEKEKH